jgi:hypothetical protein
LWKASVPMPTIARLPVLAGKPATELTDNPLNKLSGSVMRLSPNRVPAVNKAFHRIKYTL